MIKRRVIVAGRSDRTSAVQLFAEGIQRRGCRREPPACIDLHVPPKPACPMEACRIGRPAAPGVPVGSKEEP